MKNLKVILPVLILTALFAGACNQGKIDDLQRKNKALQESTQAQDSMLSEFMNAFNTFEDNLASIRNRENLIAMNNDDPELRVDGKEQIIEDIQAINELLDQNRQIIDDLNERIQKAEGRAPEYRRMVGVLKKQLEEKDTQIASLKEDLSNMSFTVASLNSKIDTLNLVASNLRIDSRAQTDRISSQDSLISIQKDRIDGQISDLNTAYYIKGSYKELKNKNILTKTGGFIGIGKIKQLIPDFDESGFTKIDITEINSIPVDDSRKVEIMTSHPSDSYMLAEEDKRVERIEITDPSKFWKSSKYLVIVTN
ncbi:MAG: hypothetical protein R8P61_04800 [Bacteroidia bacterium]|nr:hypothetical protein [Bacteroidia bacterium]